MAEGEKDEGGAIRNTADAVRGILQEVPVYKDAIRPAAKKFGSELKPAAENLGQSITTVTEALHLALAPLRGLVWGYQQIEEIVFPALQERFKQKLHRMVTPPVAIAGPAFESLRFSGAEESLREMYINLLETSMDLETAQAAHPAFVEIIRQLNPEEARLLRAIAVDYQGRLPTITVAGAERGVYSSHFLFLVRFSEYELEDKCRYPNQMPSYLDNLCRLGLTKSPNREYYSVLIGDQRDAYKSLVEHPSIVKMTERIRAREDVVDPVIFVEAFCLSSFGEQFCIACIDSKLGQKQSGDDAQTPASP
jgi:hypothetical protein